MTIKTPAVGDKVVLHHQEGEKLHKRPARVTEVHSDKVISVEAEHLDDQHPAGTFTSIPHESHPHSDVWWEWAPAEAETQTDAGTTTPAPADNAGTTQSQPQGGDAQAEAGSAADQA